MNLRIVGALNMYGGLDSSGSTLNYVQLSKLLGIPMVPTVEKDSLGIEHLLHLVVIIYECGDFAGEGEDLNLAVLRELKDWHTGKLDNHACRPNADCSPGKCATCLECPAFTFKQIYHHIHVNHGNVIEQAVKELQQPIAKNDRICGPFSIRYLALKLLEQGKEIEKQVLGNPGGKGVVEMRNMLAKRITERTGQDSELAITDVKYAFINGALKEAFTHRSSKRNTLTQKIDNLVIHKIWGYPIFLLLMFVMFEATFAIGAYPQEWIESFIGWYAESLTANMPEGTLRDLLVDGVLGGVESVLSFVPNILILYLFISMMEDSGYMIKLFA